MELGSGPVGASPGIGIGPKTALTPAALDEAADSPPASPEAERDRLLEAIEETRAELDRDPGPGDQRRRPGRGGDLHAHLLLLDDDELVGPAMSTIDRRDGHRPAGVATSRGRAARRRFGELADPYLRARADDVRAVGDHVLAHLLG